MSYQDYKGNLQWFGNDSLLAFPHYTEQFRVQNTRVATYGVPITTQQPTFTVQRGLVVATQGPVPRLPQFWGRRCKLTIKSATVVGRHAAMRVLITHKNLPAEVLDSASSNRCAANGGDIKFSLDENGTKELPCEVVTITQDADPANTRAEIWVLVPGASSTADTTFYAWWKGVDTDDTMEDKAATQPSKYEVWDFWNDYRSGVHGPHPSASAPLSFRRVAASPNNFKALTDCLGLSSSADQWGGNGAFSFASGVASRYLHIQGGDVPEGNMRAATGFVSMWFKASGAGTVRYMFNLGGWAGTVDRRIYAVMGSDNKIKFAIQDRASETALTDTVAITDTDWHHLVCTWIADEEDSLMEIYIDGGTRHQSSPIGVSGQKGVPSWFDNGGLYIGFGDSTSNHWVGDIDEPRFGTFPYPNGLAATEWFMQKASNFERAVQFDAATTPSLPAQPYPALATQYLMVGPKTNRDMQTRYRAKFTPITTEKIVGDISSALLPSPNDPGPQRNRCLFVKYTPATTKKGFLLYDAYDSYNAVQAGEMILCLCGRDPSYSTFVVPPRAAAAPLTYVETNRGVCFVEQSASVPLYFWVRYTHYVDPYVPSGSYFGRVEWVDLPAASSSGSPNAVPLDANYRDECSTNGSGSDRSVYLSFTSDLTGSLTLQVLPAYAETVTIVFYGTDSTFTTPVSTFADVTTLTESLAVNDTETYYVKVTPKRPQARTIIQALIHH